MIINSQYPGQLPFHRRKPPHANNTQTPIADRRRPTQTWILSVCVESRGLSAIAVHGLSSNTGSEWTAVPTSPQKCAVTQVKNAKARGAHGRGKSLKVGRMGLWVGPKMLVVSLPRIRLRLPRFPPPTSSQRPRRWYRRQNLGQDRDEAQVRFELNPADH
jgi:hypothetical protein